MKIKNEKVDHLISDGFDLANNGHYDAAIKTFKKTLQSDPNNIQIRYGLGILYLLNGQKQDAIKEHNIIRAIDNKLADRFEQLIL